MAVNNTTKAYSNMEFPLSMKRQDAFALDPTCVWPSLAEAQNYAKTNPTAYIGQVLSVVADGVATAYVALLAEGVDRNTTANTSPLTSHGRPPRRGRG